MKIVSFKICPFVQRVAALLEAKNLPYDIDFISLSDKPQWFLDISPHGQVPLLITDNGQALFESDAIVEYIEEAYSPLEPDISLEEKATNRAWSYLASKNYLVQCSAQRSADASTLEERCAKLNVAFSRIEKRLGANSFFGGEELGMVDIAWLPLLHRASIIERRTGFDFAADYPRLKEWQQHLLNSGLAERSVPVDFEDAFAQIYLSQQTFLGRGGRAVNCCFKESACC